MKVEHGIHDEWVKWQKEEHIPAIMATGQFSEFRFFHLLDHDDEDGITYVIQYFTPDINSYKRYIDEFAPLLRQEATARWGGRFNIFRTVMQSVQ